MKNLVCFVASLAVVAASGRAQSVQPPTEIDRAFNRIYNLDFPGAYAILDGEARAHPDNPLIYSVRGAAYLFAEFHRMSILETDFFADDDKVTNKKKVKADPIARAALLQVTEEASPGTVGRQPSRPRRHVRHVDGGGGGTGLRGHCREEALPDLRAISWTAISRTPLRLPSSGRCHRPAKQANGIRRSELPGAAAR